MIAHLVASGSCSATGKNMSTNKIESRDFHRDHRFLHVCGKLAKVHKGYIYKDLQICRRPGIGDHRDSSQLSPGQSGNSTANATKLRRQIENQTGRKPSPLQEKKLYFPMYVSMVAG